MEQNNQPTGPTPNQNGKVMDVQPPTGQMPGTGDVKLTPNQPAAQTAPQPQQAGASVPAPKPDIPPTQTPQSAGPGPQAKKKSKGPILAIVLAVIALLGLCGVAVMLYLQDGTRVDNTGQDQQQAQPVSQESQTETTTPEQATDQAVEAVDKTLQDIDETSGASEQEISDDTLGL